MRTITNYSRILKTEHLLMCVWFLKEINWVVWVAPFTTRTASLGRCYNNRLEA